MEAAARHQGGHHIAPLERMVHRVNHQIKAARQRAQLIECLHMVRSETTGFLRFREVGGEGGDLTAPGPGELKGHVAQAADPDHRHMGCGGDGFIHQRCKHRDATAKQGARSGWVHVGGQRNGPVLAGSHMAGEAALAAHDRGLERATEIAGATQALRAMAAAAADPAEAPQLPDQLRAHA